MSNNLTNNIVPKVYQAINNVYSDLAKESVKKDGYNAQQSYAYITAGTLKKILLPLLAKNKLILQSKVIDTEINQGQTKNGITTFHYRLTVEYTLINSEDGSNLVSTILGEGIDTSDKGINKALTSALKNFILQIFLVAADDEDSEKETVETKREPPSENVVWLKDKTYQSLMTSNNSKLISAALAAKTTSDGQPFKMSDHYRKELAKKLEELTANENNN